MDSILDDTTTFLKIGDVSFDDTHKLEIKSQKRFLELFKKKFISREVYKLIRPISSQKPRMYSLPKIYKSDFRLRLILSMCHSVQHSLEKWLIQVLNPVLAFYSGFCVNDSFTFSSMICQLLPCVDSQFMASFYITSLFTNVLLDGVISVCADFLYRSPLTSVPSFPESVFVELATKSVSFSFNETMYCQVDGFSMGSPLGPILTNIFVGFYEKLVFEMFPKPYIYLRYVDDTFTCFYSRNEALSFFKRLNKLYPSLTFTMDEEKDNKLPCIG